MRTLLTARMLIGILQSALILGGCADFFFGSGRFLSISVLALVFLTVAQLFIIGLIAILKRT